MILLRPIEEVFYVHKTPKNIATGNLLLIRTSRGPQFINNDNEDSGLWHGGLAAKDVIIIPKIYIEELYDLLQN